MRGACDAGDLTRAALAPAPYATAALAIGKAARPMLRAAADVLDLSAAFSLTVGPPEASEWPHLTADHPVPTERNVLAAMRTLDVVRTLRALDRAPERLLVLLSGGASALLTSPADGLTLDDISAVTRALLRAGAPIDELNTVRKHVERLKGGRFAAELPDGMHADVLVLSDVIGDRLDVVGSGPFAHDPSTYGDALAVLDRRSARQAAPAVTRFLEAGARGEHPETAKPGNPAFERVRHAVIGSNRTAAEAAERAAVRLGFRVAHLELEVVGEAAREGRRLASLALEHARDAGPSAIILGGETTVTVGGAAGVGGRNQELALAAAIELERAGNRAAERAGMAAVQAPRVAVASFATDGVDGPTDAAGAIATDETCGLARSLGLHPEAALAGHDSHSFFAALDRAGHPHLIRTGPTGTNVNDIAVALVYPP
ncbi:MAG: DUF4147 domain-containing protein [Phycisphaerales bacterium]